MNEQRIETNESPHIMIPACTGQVVVKSWRQTAVSIQGPSFTVEQNDSIHITSQDDLFLAVPEQTRVSLGIIYGDVVLKHIQGGITGDDLQGNVTINNVDAVQIDRVGQALFAEDINGLLNVQHVGGTVSLQRVSGVSLGSVKSDVVVEYANGEVSLNEVEGKLFLKSINGNLMVANVLSDVVLQNLGGRNMFFSVSGDIWLVGGLRAAEHLFKSYRSIYVYWPEDAPMRLFANASQIDHKLSLEDEKSNDDGKQIFLTGHIEEGNASLALEAVERIAIRPLGNGEPQFSPDEFMVPEEPAGKLAQQVQTAVHAVLAESAEMDGLEERLVTAVVAALAAWEPQVEEKEIAAEKVVAEPEPKPELYIVDTTESRTHILALVRDGLISIGQADVLLEALN